MLLKNYCGVFFNSIEDIAYDIFRICEGKPTKATGDGIVIYTFVSAVDVKTLTEYFKVADRNFLLFELDNNTSGFNFTDKQKENKLFNLIKDDKRKIDFEDLSNQLMDEFIKTTRIEPTPIPTDFNLDNLKNLMGDNDNLTQKTKKIDINHLTKSEINNEIDKLIDKGINNLSNTEKEYLENLSKLI